MDDADSIPPEAEVNEEKLLVYIQGLSLRLVELAAPDGAPLTREAVQARLLEALLGDGDAKALLGTVYEDGRAEAYEEVAAAGQAPSGARRENWQDIASPGERKARWRTDSACNRCAHAAVCVVARSTPQEWLAVVSRCLHFVALPR